MGNLDLTITIKGWLDDYSILIKGKEYKTIKDAINIALHKFDKYTIKIEEITDSIEDLPPVKIAEIEIREINPD